MPIRPSRWTLPGSSVPYLLVWWHDALAKDITRRRIPAEQALQQLDNWVVSHETVLQHIAEGLKGDVSDGTGPLAKLGFYEHHESMDPRLWANASAGAVTLASRGFSQQLKARISAALQSNRLIVLEADPIVAPPKPKGPPPPKRKVTYTLKVTSSPTLRLPYAVAINGVVVQHADRPGSIPSGQAFTVEVEANSTVSLFLNSDAHPSHRKNPVYGVTPTARDIVVTITEKAGKHKDSAVPVFKKTKGAKGKEVDYYEAALTGDIWMQVSHKYTEADAESYVPATTDSGIRTALLSIYREELKKNSLTVVCAAAAGGSTQSITLDFEGSNNPSQNINSFSLLTDGLTRVHPKAFLVLLEAARSAGLKNLTLSSNWRPMLGSIAHRAGLGVDVSYMEDATHKVTLNRQELRKGTPDYAWVSTKEIQLYGKYTTAKTQVTQADAAVKTASQKLAKLRSDLNKAQKSKVALKKDPAKLAVVEANIEELNKAIDAAVTEEKTARDNKTKAATQRDTDKKAWAGELDANEPACMRNFREALKVNAMVGEFFDPWYMDGNTRDKVAARPNEQCTGNETLHAHHLHITIHEPLLLA